MPNQKNIAQLAEIEAQVANATAMWLVDYRGLTVKQTEALRRAVREAGAEMKVYKNTLVNIALQNAEQPDMTELLSGPNGFIFTTAEDVAPSAKAIKTFAQTNKKLEIRGGLYDGQVLDAAQVIAIADLPSREALYSMIAAALVEPMATLARALKAVAEKDEEQAA